MQRTSMWLNLFGLQAVKKCIFSVFSPFLSLCRTAWRPYKLSHIDALCINLLYQSKDQCLKFSQKKLRIGGVEHLSFFSQPFFQKHKRKLLHPHENQSMFIMHQGWVEILMITLVYSNRVSVRNNLLHKALYLVLYFT
jgi:hypothetical protein